MGMAANIAKGRSRFTRLVEEFRNDENGATAIEYGLIVSLVFVVILAAVKNVAESNSENYDTITTTINNAIE